MSPEAFLRELLTINNQFYAAERENHIKRTNAIIQLSEKAVGLFKVEPEVAQ